MSDARTPQRLKIDMRARRRAGLPLVGLHVDAGSDASLVNLTGESAAGLYR